MLYCTQCWCHRFISQKKTYTASVPEVCSCFRVQAEELSQWKPDQLSLPCSHRVLVEGPDTDKAGTVVIRLLGKKLLRWGLTWDVKFFHYCL